MTKGKWNYGMLETKFEEARQPTNEEFMRIIEGKLNEPGSIEALFSGKILEKNEFWTFIRHRADPEQIHTICKNKVSSIQNYTHSYNFKRFHGDLALKLMGSKHKYIGIANVPEAEEYDDTELKTIMKNIEKNTPFHVAWVSKITRPDDKNTYFFLTGNVHPADVEEHKIVINKKIKALNSDIYMIQKFAHHKSHRRSAKEKISSIKENIPEDYVDQDWLKEYEYFNWNK